VQKVVPAGGPGRSWLFSGNGPDRDRHQRLRAENRPQTCRGRAFWTFRLISDSATVADKFISSEAPATYDAALKRAKEVAVLRRSVLIVVEPPAGE
jgi:hypothetical protein